MAGTNAEERLIAGSDEDLLRRALALQAELEQYSEHLSNLYADYFQPVAVPTQIYTSFNSDLRGEISLLQKIVNNVDGKREGASHTVRSSNLPYLEALWGTAKRSSEIIMLRYAVSSATYPSQIMAPGTRIVRTQGESRPSKDCNLVVDIVADGGQSWWKVSSMTNRRLIFDMAREAIFCGDDSEDEDDDNADRVLQSSDADIPLVKLAKNLASAAQGYRIRTKCPTLYLVLPRMVEGEHPKIDMVLNTCRKMGVCIICGNELPLAPELSADVLDRMSPNPKARFSETLNLDTSVLIGLASDFSHTNVPKHSWFRQSHLDHADLESKQPALSLFYPILGSHGLVCTSEAEEVLRHIVDTIATEDEKARIECLVWGDPQWSREERLQKLQSLSIHDVPPGLQLPVRIVDFNEKTGAPHLPNIVKERMEIIPNPGRSVLMYGWTTGQTTITCNSVAVKQLERSLETLPDLGEVEWPSIWPVPTSRPLVGTPPPEKGHKRVRRHIGDCRVKCTCGVQELYGGQEDVTILPSRGKNKQ